MKIANALNTLGLSESEAKDLLDLTDEGRLLGPNTIRRALHEEAILKEGQAETLLAAFGLVHAVAASQSNGALDRPVEVARRLVELAYGSQEEMWVIFVDCNNQEIARKRLGAGSHNSLNYDAGYLVELAMRHRAEAAFLAHNHPNGDVVASDEDVRQTQYARNALDAVGVTLHDHLIVAGSDFYSIEAKSAGNVLVGEEE